MCIRDRFVAATVKPLVTNEVTEAGHSEVFAYCAVEGYLAAEVGRIVHKIH